MQEGRIAGMVSGITCFPDQPARIGNLGLTLSLSKAAILSK